ncbi:MAG: tetrathionate reductase family octaheme c-type cytochrome [Rhodospirillales bacterium]|nr:MAG: tetrathionate reductase family octaheme c-type cytochrome [Rhodospirillales bacterium]
MASPLFSWKIFLAATILAGLTPGGAALAAGVISTADHSKFKELEGPFETGPEVTRACLQCHTEAARQIHKTKHWTWSAVNERTGQLLGKRNVINNFCVSTQSNIAACSSCHVGYGWKDDSFDFTAEENVDCLVCHDTTYTYDKQRLREGRSINLRLIASKVGRTSRATCGTCHFRGGGGDAVKHGDLDPSMTVPDMFLDVHMDADGLNFTCSTCHTTDAHMVSGSRYAPNASGASRVVVPGATERSRASCQACHGQRPMKSDKLNDHTDRLACTTCHVPAFARGDFPTKTWWDWSTAGRLDAEGQPVSELDAAENEIYNSKKGDFRWDRDVLPEYVWFNGNVRYTLVGDRIDPDGVVAINSFEGGADDPDSRIWPVKVMRGKQPYDAVNLTMAPIHTTGKDGFWKTFDWQESVARGMAVAGAPFSGEIGFVETTMMWPIAHMVAPVEKTVGCEECHARNGRMARLAGMYVPGGGRWPWLDYIGFGLAFLALAGVLAHGTLRIVFRGGRRGEPEGVE